MSLKTITRAVAAVSGMLAISVQANAADIYAGGLKDAPVYAPAAGWTGFYLGVNGGYGWAADDAKASATVNKSINTGSVEFPAYTTYTDTKKWSLSPSGGFGGGQIGYNSQGALHPNLVLGVEADVDGASIKDSAHATLAPVDVGGTPSGNTYNASAQSELDWFGTVRGRIGYAFGNGLIYFTGGFAYGGVKDSLRITNAGGTVATVGKSATNTGYVLGGGLEYRISPAWSIKAEYQYLDLGGETISISQAAIAANTAGVQALGKLSDPHTFDTVRIGLNYRIAPGYEPLK